MFTAKQVKTRIATLAAAALAALFFQRNTNAQQPSAQEILREARLSQSEQHRVLAGRLRHASDSIPFRLTIDGGEMRYEFSNPAQTLRLRLGEKSSRLDEIAGGDAKRVSAARFDQQFRNTDISYEDLTLHFLYWPGGEVLGEDSQLTRRCWKLRLRPPGKNDSQYGVMQVWIEQESGALLQAEGYDWSGRLARRFKVVSAQKLDGVWLLKNMRIESYENGKPRGGPPTYLEITGMEK